MATDARGFDPNATTIASALRHTSRRVHVRLFLRGMDAASFSTGRLTVEFLPVTEGLAGSIPSHVTQSTFDRLLVLRDCPDWDRALILDYDQLVLCDLAPLFDMPMDGNLLAARLWNKSLGEAARDWFGRSLPEQFSDAAKGPFFYMGPLLDLNAARCATLWEKIVAAHQQLGMEEQIALTVACEGRIKGIDPSWNLVPQWDKPVVPGGILHFTGPEKPWNAPWLRCAAWWQSQQTSWEQLRSGEWEGA